MKIRKGKKLSVIAGLVIIVCFAAVQYFPSVAPATEYKSLENVKSAKAVFDLRTGQPMVAFNTLELIGKTYKALIDAKKKPKFVVVFFGPSLRLISRNTSGFKPDEVKVLHKIAQTVSALSREGIKLEICLVSAKNFHVNPESVLPEIDKVPNGWIALIEYQARGYSLVPAYY